MTDMAAPKLTTSGLNKKFGDLLALDDINLAIEDGEFICIVGPSGCGKTTFLRIVAGLETASHGEVRIDSEVVKAPASIAASSSRATIFCRGARCYRMR